MSQWTHVTGTIYLYSWIELEDSIFKFMKSNFDLIPRGSEGPIEYFFNSGDRITASCGRDSYIKGTGAITFIGDLRDMSEVEFCEGLDEFLKKVFDELPIRDLTIMIKDEWRPTYKHYYMYGDELRIEEIPKMTSREPR